MKKESYFKVSCINDCLYHIEANWFIDKDKDMAQVLNITVKEYRNILKKFNGINYYNEIYFNNKHDLHRALAYIDELYEDILVIKKLIGK